MANKVSRASFIRKYGVKPCTNHTGKMKGMHSLSTSVRLNPICQARAKNPDCICHECYANAMVDIYPDLENVLAKNTEVLTQVIIPVDEWYHIHNRDYYRLEAFGDLVNVIHAINYINFATANPDTTLTNWTKNPEFFETARKMGYIIPPNLIIGQSSKHINQVDAPKYDFIAFVFTVFTKEYAEKHGIEINCGARKCITCLKCYKHHKGVMYINELLKRI